jgi:hypothetical protein
VHNGCLADWAAWFFSDGGSGGLPAEPFLDALSVEAMALIRSTPCPEDLLLADDFLAIHDLDVCFGSIKADGTYKVIRRVCYHGRGGKLERRERHIALDAETETFFVKRGVSLLF